MTAALPSPIHRPARRFRGIVLASAFLATTIACATRAQVPAAQRAAEAHGESCTITLEDQARARLLPWQQFDQIGDAPGSFRVLADRGCPRAALAAYADWLEHGVGFGNERERAIGTFHRAQLLAFTGRAPDALDLMRTAQRDTTTGDPAAVVWNTYVDGVIGFFEGDRARIEAAQAALRQANGDFAQRQVGVLQGLLNCLGESYGRAMAPRCRTGGG